MYPREKWTVAKFPPRAESSPKFLHRKLLGSAPGQCRTQEARALFETHLALCEEGETGSQ
jgi:hypothetical protein